MSYLSERGEVIFKEIEDHVRNKLQLFAIDYLELSMLANSFDVYEKNAEFCNKNGQTLEIETKTGTYPMVRPEYTIMKTEYGNILKHSGKFGLNPGDREKIFKKIKEPKKGKAFDMKAA